MVILETKRLVVQDYQSDGDAEEFVERHFAAPTGLQVSSTGIENVTEEHQRSSSTSLSGQCINGIEIPIICKKTTELAKWLPEAYQRSQST